MATECIYCRAALTPATHLAHIWPRSMGGRLRSREICCDTCNTAIGVAEDNLRQSFSHTYASVGATNDRRIPFEVIVEFQGNEFSLSNGNAALEVSRPRFDAETRTMVVPLPAGLDEQADLMARTMWQHGWRAGDESKLNLAPGDPGPQLPIGPTRNEHDLKVGGSMEHKRVFVKMALELLAYHRHDLAMAGPLSEARRFARHATGTIQSKPDAASAGCGLIPLDHGFEIYNGIEVWSCNRTVFFRAVFLGPLVFTGTLTTGWTGECFRAAYAFNARNPANVIVNVLDTNDGPNLAVWFHGVREETIDAAMLRIEEISKRLAESAPQVEQEPPPDIDALRRAVGEQFVELERRRGR